MVLLHGPGNVGDTSPVGLHLPGVYYRGGGAEVHIFVETTVGRTASLRQGWSEEELRSGYCSHFAFRVDDLDEYRKRLAEHGVPLVGGPRVRGDDVEQIYCADPDGNIVELLTQLDGHTAERRRREIIESGQSVPIAPSCC
ncbi:VOC family protein [Frankia sp. Cppng1_Ct_nod]|uniref:VOC family protein n=1 Tax=Frankia sp. Cppng1_Ct_nod TaxID=2897162 RepID=UPI00104132F2